MLKMALQGLETREENYVVVMNKAVVSLYFSSPTQWLISRHDLPWATNSVKVMDAFLTASLDFGKESPIPPLSLAKWDCLYVIKWTDALQVRWQCVASFQWDNMSNPGIIYL